MSLNCELSANADTNQVINSDMSADTSDHALDVMFNSLKCNSGTHLSTNNVTKHVVNKKSAKESTSVEEEEEELAIVYDSLEKDFTNLRITSDESRDTANDSTTAAAEAAIPAGEYYVEDILDHRVDDSSGQTQYLLKWEGYGEEENSWQFETQVTGCQELLQRFRSETVNGRYPVKSSWDEFDKFVDYVKWAVGNGLQDLAALYRLSDHKHSVDELRANKKLVRQLKNQMKTNIGHFLSLKFDRLKPETNNQERQRAMRAVKGVAIILRLKDNGFETLTDWFKFIDRRSEMAKRLARFADKCNKVIAEKREGVRISVANDYDLEVPVLEQYVCECVYDKSLFPKSTIKSCECDDCFKDRKTCCPSRTASFPMVYNQKGLLRDDILNEIENPMIIECTECKCGADCPNRVIQRGRRYRLQIYRPPDAAVRGWAVRALQRIPSGAFVSNYTGEVVSSSEANKRPNIYLFEAIWPMSRWFGTVDDRANEYVIDADKCGNVSRFINHSCEPNCAVFYSYIHSDNEYLPTVSLFTTRAIKPYEELTIDYGSYLKNTHDRSAVDDSQSVSGAGDSVNTTKDLTEEADSNGNDVSTGVANGGGESRPAADRPERLALKRIECHCGSKYCRKYLYS